MAGPAEENKQLVEEGFRLGKLCRLVSVLYINKALKFLKVQCVIKPKICE